MPQYLRPIYLRNHLICVGTVHRNSVRTRYIEERNIPDILQIFREDKFE